jgi:hypothetical protein
MYVLTTGLLFSAANGGRSLSCILAGATRKAASRHEHMEFDS